MTADKATDMTDEVRQEDRELLPCAFCGGEAKLGGFKLAPDGYWISCQQKPCCASIDCFDTKEAAIAVWNASPLRTRIAELEGALGEIVARAPYPAHGDGEACHRCCHCGYRWPDRFEERHANHCAYVIARAILNGEKKDG